MIEISKKGMNYTVKDRGAKSWQVQFLLATTTTNRFMREKSTLRMYLSAPKAPSNEEDEVPAAKNDEGGRQKIQ